MGWRSRAYRGASHALALAGPAVLRRRLARGKEDPARWTEKLGQASQPRPDGPVVWMHGVGLGEVMALRALIEAMRPLRPDLWYLVTSTARSSGDVFAKSLPYKTIHQYLPLDAPGYLDRFLAHWQPCLSIWSEQDLWPGAIYAAARRRIPLALVNARITAASAARRRRAAGLFAETLGRFALVAAQDEGSARRLIQLGAKDAMVRGRLKPAAPDLPVNADHLAALQSALGDARPWVAASLHDEDREAVANALRSVSTPAILVPRDIKVAAQWSDIVKSCGRRVQLASTAGTSPFDVLIGDTYGDLGLWYRLADRALIGGTFGPTEGHNPWEAAALGCAIYYGPRIANFGWDFNALRHAAAARQVDPASLATALNQPLLDEGARGQALVDVAREGLRPLARDLCALIR